MLYDKNIKYTDITKYELFIMILQGIDIEDFNKFMQFSFNCNCKFCWNELNELYDSNNCIKWNESFFRKINNIFNFIFVNTARKKKTFLREEDMIMNIKIEKRKSKRKIPDNLLQQGLFSQTFLVLMTIGNYKIKELYDVNIYVLRLLYVSLINKYEAHYLKTAIYAGTIENKPKNNTILNWLYRS